MAALFLIRISLAVVFLFLAVERLKYGNPQNFEFTMFAIATKGAAAWIQPWMQNVLLPQSLKLYHVLTAFYLVMGLFFMIGAWVRFFTIFLLGFSFLFGALTFNLGFVYRIISLFGMVISVGMLINNPGHLLGMDGWRKKRKNKPLALPEENL